MLLEERDEMEGIVKLYDIRNNDYPNQRGDTFRSLQVFECWVCGAISNSVVMGGYPGYGVRVICPNSAECWHHELEKKVEWLDKPHPRKYKADLKKEIDNFKKKHRHQVKNDISGEPDMKQKRGVTNVFSWKKGGSCTHLLDH